MIREGAEVTLDFLDVTVKLIPGSLERAVGPDGLDEGQHHLKDFS